MSLLDIGLEDVKKKQWLVLNNLVFTIPVSCSSFSVIYGWARELNIISSLDLVGRTPAS